MDIATAKAITRTGLPHTHVLTHMHACTHAHMYLQHDIKSLAHREQVGGSTVQ